MRVEAVSLPQFAKTLYKLAKSDRYNLIAVSGFMGVGKSCFMDKLARAYSKVSNTTYSVHDNMTWSRQELAEWIDGDEENNNKNQKPEYSGIVADELISMINKRNWYKSGQKGLLELLNKCRDRHLLLLGAVPVFDNLDSMYKDITGFWIFIARRGVAWVLEPEVNPFSKDPWNMGENHKLFRKHGNPYRSFNFVCEVHYNDWTPKEKVEYYKVRNKKRKNTENQDDNNNIKVHDSVKQRNEIIRYGYTNNLLTADEISQATKLSKRAINYIIKGER